MSNSTITNNTNSYNQHVHHHQNNNNRINNGTQACAACKYQRRKCAPDCVLAPYFPHDRQRQFLNSHKLFGVSNITKIIRTLSPPNKDMAMRTIIFQSDARAKDPVGGCLRIIAELNHQYEYYKAELDLVLQQLQLCKAQIYQQQQQHAHIFQMADNVGLPTQPLEANTTHVEAAAGNNSPTGDHNNQGSNELVTCDNENYHQYQALMRYYYDDNTQQQYLPIPQQQEQHQNNDQYSWVAPSHEDAVLASSNSSTSHGECFIMKSSDDFGGECQGLEMKPQIHQIDANGASYDEDREYGSKFDNSSTHIDLSCCDLQGSLLKFDVHQRTELSGELVALKEEKIVLENPEVESFHHIPEHDLRNAATLFTLTN